MKRACIFMVMIPFFMFSFVKNEKNQVEQYSVKQFMSNTSVFGSSFSPNENKVLYTSNESGVYNAYEYQLNQDSAKQLTQREETTYAISYFPDDHRVLLMSDRGGNELYHIYLRKMDGTIKDLTPYKEARASFSGWSHDRKSFFFTSNKRDPKYMDLYEMSLNTMEPSLVFENTEGFNVGPVSNDKTLLALTKTITNTKNQMYLHNLESGKTKQITDFEGNATFSPVGFSNDQIYLYYITDVNSEFDYLKRLNLETGEKEKVYETNWDVMYAYHSYNEKYRVIGINQDAQTVVKVFDMETGEEIDFPTFEGKNISSVNISDTEKRMAFYVSSSRTPQNLYVYNFESKEYDQLTHSLNPEIDEKDLVKGNVVRYQSFDGTEIPSILYKPHQATAKNKVPSLVYVHGGPGGQSRLGYRASIQYLVNHGYAVIAVNNRGSSGYGKTFYEMDDMKHGDADLKDCIYAKDYLADQEWVVLTAVIWL